MQGAFREHRKMLERCGADVVEVRNIRDLDRVEGLIIPGGESTSICILLQADGLFEAIRKKIADGMPAFGTCAGLVMLAKRVVDGRPDTFGMMDITVERNAYGRQVESFEAGLELEGFDGSKMPAVFIRAPQIVEVGKQVQTLAYLNGRPVLVREGHCLAGSFHPELTDDLRLHQYFLKMVVSSDLTSCQNS